MSVAVWTMVSVREGRRLRRPEPVPVPEPGPVVAGFCLAGPGMAVEGTAGRLADYLPTLV